ncbi:hypothetical protein C2G38_2155005 [Gigaspora rosea]|uniref:Uncharacterized protein n=1 Tax=Gigaspora rosea TaxID=44941 RepID=A0A397W8A5_9GLOM|nr:hypothetical protein C2G38_2155005 [Gigaspora rosea]
MTSTMKSTEKEAPATITPTTNSDDSISIRPPAKMSEKYKRPPIRPPENHIYERKINPQKRQRNINCQIQKKSNANIDNTNDNTNNYTNYDTNYNSTMRDNKLNK